MMLFSLERGMNGAFFARSGPRIASQSCGIYSKSTIHSRNAPGRRFQVDISHRVKKQVDISLCPIREINV